MKEWLQFLKKGSDHLTKSISALFTGKNNLLDRKILEALEELLISADVDVNTASRLILSLSETYRGQKVTVEEVKTFLADNISRLLKPIAKPLIVTHAIKPYVILVIGVNGSGKTTTIGKIAYYLRFHEGLRTSLVAGDTFRAAAAEQLKVWSEKSGCPIVGCATGTDAAGLIFDSFKISRFNKDDVLLIDTAGRLQNKTHLMAELQKIIRVLRKLDQSAPHACLLIIDATVGQNAHSQVEIFQKMTDVSGLVITKLDGTAKGGVLISLSEKFKIPVHYVGVGEEIEDLQPFSAFDFSYGLLGLETRDTCED